MAGLVLGKFPDQQGYSISRLEMHRFEQSALLVTAENLPAGISVESRQELFDDINCLARNMDPTDEQRKPLADNVAVRMREFMKKYCDLAKPDSSKYGPEYLKEFQKRYESAQAGPGRVIRENSKAGPVALIGMGFFLFGALMRMRYD